MCLRAPHASHVNVVAHIECFECVLSYSSDVEKKLILIYELYLIWNFQKYFSVQNWNMDKSQIYIWSE